MTCYGIRSWAYWAVLLASAVALTGPLYAASETSLVTYVMVNGRETRCIPLRRFDDRHLVVTTKGIKSLAVNSFTVAGRMTHEAILLDKILTSVERALDDEEFAVAARIQKQLGNAVATYNAMAKPTLAATGVLASGDRAALRLAVDYYKAQQNQLPKTMSVLRTCQKINVLSHAVRFHQRASNLGLLKKLIELTEAMESVDSPVPLARLQIKKASAQLHRLVAQCYKVLRASVSEDLQKYGNTRSAVDLLKTIHRSAAVTDTFETKMEDLIDEVVARCAAYRVALETHTQAMLTQNEQDRSLAVSRNRVIVRNMGDFNRFLKGAQGYIFGNNRAVFLKRMNKAAALNVEVLQANAVKKREFESMLGTMIDAEEAYKKGSLLLSFKLYTQLTAAMAENDVGHGNKARIKVMTHLTRVEAALLQKQLKDASGTSLEALAEIAGRSTELLHMSTKELTDLGFDVVSFANDVKMIEAYLDYHKKVRGLRKTTAPNPVDAWLSIREISEWIAAGRNVHRLAKLDWDRRGPKLEGDIFARIHVHFISHSRDLSMDRFETILRSLIDYAIQAKRNETAVSLVDVGFDRSRKDGKDPFVRSLVNVDLKVAMNYSDAGKTDLELAIYSGLNERFPELAKELDLDTKKASAIERTAVAALKNGDADGALAIYNSLCQAYTAYAKKNRLFAKLLDLWTEKAGGDSMGREDVLEVYNAFSSEFSGQLKALPQLEDVRTDILGNFRKAWESDHHFKGLQDMHRFTRQYPSLSDEVELVEFAFVAVVKNVTEIDARIKTQDRPVPPASTLRALDWLNSRYNKEMREHGLYAIHFRWKLARADAYFDNESFSNAAGIYMELLATFPKLAKEKGLDKKMDDLKWSYRIYLVMEQFNFMFLPLSVHTRRDQGMFFIGVLLWLMLIRNGIRKGFKNNRIVYRLGHLAVALGVFVLVLIVFISLDMVFFHASLLAFVLPAIGFQVAGSVSYKFFPIIYFERRLRWTRFLNSIISRFIERKDSYPGRALLVRMNQILTADTERIEAELPQLHDPRFLVLEKAVVQARNSPVKALRRIDEVIQSMGPQVEDNDDHDPKMRRYYLNCQYAAGSIAYQLNRTTEAKNYLSSLVAIEPKHIRARRLLATIYYESMEYEHAIPHLKTSLAADGSDDQLWYLLGCCFRETGIHSAAYKCFLSMDEPGREEQLSTARACMRAGRLKEAEAVIAARLSDDPQDSEAIVLLAILHARIGDDAKAMLTAAGIADDDPVHYRIVALKAALLLREGELERAEALYREVLDAEPNYVPALLGMGQILTVHGDEESADACFDRILSTSPNHLEAHYGKGCLYAMTDPDRGRAHLTQALASEELVEAAARQLGRINFISGRYDDALTEFRKIKNRELFSTWDLYMFAYSAARGNAIDLCEQSLIRLMGGRADDEGWVGSAAAAMYSIAWQLIGVGAFKTAIACLEYVKEHASSHAAETSDLIEEYHFRWAATMLANGDEESAAAALEDLLAVSADAERKQLCTFYLVLCHFASGDYEGASFALEDLEKLAPGEPRYQYHRIIADFACDRDSEALALLATVESAIGLPDYLKIGCTTIRAYITARDGELQTAADDLPTINVGSADFVGADDVRQHVNLLRALYLSHLKDTSALADLQNEASLSEQVDTALLKALIEIDAGTIDTAHATLGKVKESDQVKPLYILVSTALTIEKLRANAYAEAREIIDGLPELLPELVSVRAALCYCHGSDSLSTPDDMSKIIAEIQEFLPKVNDALLKHELIRTTLILHLVLAVRVEDSAVDSQLSAQNCWKQCTDLWETAVFTNHEHWNRELSRLSAVTDQVSRSFSKAELSVISAEFVDEVLMPIITEFIVGAIYESQDHGVRRHIQILSRLGDRFDRRTEYLSGLGVKLETMVASLPAGDPVRVTWGFLIGLSEAQLLVSSAQGYDTSSLRDNLKLYRSCRNHYENMLEFHKAKRMFFADILSIIADGCDGRFRPAGDALGRKLRDIPIGVEIQRVEDRLRLLIEACRNPNRSMKRGMNLDDEFEKLRSEVQSIVD